MYNTEGSGPGSWGFGDKNLTECDRDNDLFLPHYPAMRADVGEAVLQPREPSPPRSHTAKTL
jgi:hypothetical protein